MSEDLVYARGLHKAYGSGALRTPVLRGVDVTLGPGRFVALMGPSGCGKTTLLNLLGALDHPDEGELWVAGVPLHRATVGERRAFRASSLGFVFQDSHLLPTLTALENIEVVGRPLGLGRRALRTRAEGLLDRVGLLRWAGSFPGQLSGGERQRVAVARALLRRPALVLADEPTGSLDQGSSAEVVALMRELVAEHGSSLFVVTHDPALGAQADEVLRLEGGRVAS